MVEFISSWTEQIVLAIVISTIIELILPENSNKKYIQIVIGVYILFNIISPVIKNKNEISIDKYKIEENKISSKYEIDQSSMDKRIEKIYLEELEEKIKAEFEESGITVEECKVDATLNSSEKNAGIHTITVKIIDPFEKGTLNNVIEAIIEKYEIESEKIILNIK